MYYSTSFSVLESNNEFFFNAKSNLGAEHKVGARNLLLLLLLYYYYHQHQHLL